MDVDGSGDLTFEEFRKGFINFGLKFNLRETKCLFRLFDVNGDGTLSYAEFVAATIERVFFFDEKNLKSAFQRLNSFYSY